MKSLLKIFVLLCVFAGAAMCVRAQTAVPPPMPAYQPMADQQLDELLGPIALYPDPLIAQILPASTMPTQIVLADRYVSGGGDLNQIDQQPWDPSVQALARYPTVLKWMDDNLNWTTDLGQAFLYQQQEVMGSIQRLRTSANNVGNLQSTPQQQVVNDGGYIQIVPANPQVIYVPVYQPDQVYYQTCYGPPFITFGIGFPIGLWLNFDFDWGHHDIVVWGHDHPRPSNWWHEPSHQRDMGHTTVWHRDNYPGAVAVNHGDRGYVHNRPAVVTPGRSTFDSAAERRTTAPAARPEAPTTRASMPVAHSAPAPGVARPESARQVPQHDERAISVPHPAPAPVQRSQPASRPASTGALIGIQSSHDTRAYSTRGQQSVQTIPHSAPAPRQAPASPQAPVSRPATSSGNGNGGGDNNPNSDKRH